MIKIKKATIIFPMTRIFILKRAQRRRAGKYEYYFSDSTLLYTHELPKIDKCSEEIFKKSKAKEIAFNFTEMDKWISNRLNMYSDIDQEIRSFIRVLEKISSLLDNDLLNSPEIYTALFIHGGDLRQSCTPTEQKLYALSIPKEIITPEIAAKAILNQSADWIDAMASHLNDRNLTENILIQNKLNCENLNKNEDRQIITHIRKYIDLKEKTKLLSRLISTNNISETECEKWVQKYIVTFDNLNHISLNDFYHTDHSNPSWIAQYQNASKELHDIRSRLQGDLMSLKMDMTEHFWTPEKEKIKEYETLHKQATLFGFTQ